MQTKSPERQLPHGFHVWLIGLFSSTIMLPFYMTIAGVSVVDMILTD